MKLLLDENVPKRLKEDLIQHEVFTVREKGWNGLKNGELLKLMLSESFLALLTFDKNLQYQQNFLKYPITVIILNAPSNQYRVLKDYMDKVNKLCNEGNLGHGPIIIQI